MRHSPRVNADTKGSVNMLPETSAPSQVEAPVAPGEPEPFVAGSPMSRRPPSVASTVARIFGVVIAVVGSALVVFMNLGSLAMVLVALGLVAMIATLLIRSWWALLIVPVANTAGFVGTLSFVFIFEHFTHGGDIQNPGELALAVVFLVFALSALPALVGATVGVLAWRGWNQWRDR